MARVNSQLCSAWRWGHAVEADRRARSGRGRFQEMCRANGVRRFYRFSSILSKLAKRMPSMARTVREFHSGLSGNGQRARRDCSQD